LKLANAHDNVALPQNIHPHVFTTLAWDNIDRIEETLTGASTSHRVNGIIVQPRVFGPEPYKPPLPTIPKNKKRSLMIEDTPLPIYTAGERVGPSQCTTLDVNREAFIAEAHKKNIMWMLTRRLDTDNQVVMAWTGFNIILRRDLPVVQDIYH